jgi:hypothetical protein
MSFSARYTCFMRLRSSLWVACLVIVVEQACAAAPAVELEVATEQGVQITAPQEWLQLITAMGIEHVRIRAMRAGDEPRVVDQGKVAGARFHVVGILTRGDQLRLPGRIFSRSDRGQLEDYLAQLAADGAESVTAVRGRFGLTEKEMQAVLAELTQPVNFETKGQSLRMVIKGCQSKMGTKFVIDADADGDVQASSPVVDEVKGISAGTALALVLRGNRLVMRPEKLRGQSVAYRIARLTADELAKSTIGRLSGDEAVAMRNWPVGWEFDETPGDVAPTLSEFLNAEIDGYTLAEALAAIEPRAKIPFYVDRAVLKARQIDPTKIQVKLARTRTSYKRVIDRVLAQARLGGQLRVDEAGTPFIWITH